MTSIIEIDLNDFSSGPNWLSPQAQREAKRLEHIKRLREAADARRKARRAKDKYESLPDPVPPADEPGEPEPPSDDPNDPSHPADA